MNIIAYILLLGSNICDVTASSDIHYTGQVTYLTFAPCFPPQLVLLGTIIY